jgi:anti-sigma regulatory factor (Ser/Thr protein kinase)
MNTTAAFPMADDSGVHAARRAAQLAAERLGFSPEGAGRAALVASELATNLARHARDGQLLVRALGPAGGGDEPPGLDILALDRGPGISDVAWSRTDGHSTGGTLGQGLGAVERQSHLFQIYTQPAGTACLARLWRDAPPDPRTRPRCEVGAVLVSKPGESIAGDDLGWTLRSGRLAVFLADGLGHGLSAHDASSAAVRLFRAIEAEAPLRIVTEAHAALRPTRGAAVAALALDLDRGVARYCGLGNIGAAIVHDASTRQGLVSHNGTAGHHAARITEFTYPVPRGSTIVLHTDGLTTHWDLARYPGLLRRHPSLIAGVLYRDFGRGHDDAAVVVVSERPELFIHSL